MGNPVGTFGVIAMKMMISTKCSGRRVKALCICSISTFHTPARHMRDLQPRWLGLEASAQPRLFYWKSSAAVFPPNSMLVTLLLSTSTCEAAAFDGN